MGYPALAEFRRIVADNAAARSNLKPQPAKYEKKPPEFPVRWNDNGAVELLKKLWSDGLSASQIAARIGNVTRNAVIGKVHRLGLEGRRTEQRTPRTPRASKQPRITVPVHKPAQILVPVLPVPDLGPSPAVITLANINELTETMCHWPFGDPLEEGFHYCARRKSRDASYCEHHAAFAYQRGQRQPKPKGKNGFYWLDLAGRNAKA